MALPAPLLQLKTYDDLLAMPEDGRRYELIQGELFMSPSSKLRHQDALLGLYDVMRAYVRETRAGKLMIAPFDVKFSETSVVQPDLFVVRAERAIALTEDFMDGSPDLIVEVLSPSNRGHDLIKKAALYLDHGVPEYWVADPESRQIVVNVLEQGRYVAQPVRDEAVRSTVLPGLAVKLTDVFPDDEQG